MTDQTPVSTTDGPPAQQRATWNTAEQIAEHRAMTPSERIETMIALSNAALALARAERVDER